MAAPLAQSHGTSHMQMEYAAQINHIKRHKSQQPARRAVTYGGNAIERGSIGAGGGGKRAKDGRSGEEELHRGRYCGLQFAVSRLHKLLDIEE